MELDDGHGDGGDQKMIFKCSNLEKKNEKIKWAQGKGIFNRTILFCHSRHLVGVSRFRIDNRTIKRRNLELQWLSSATEYVSHLHLPSA